MAEYEKLVRNILRTNDCVFVRHGKGDHDIWYSPISKRHITVDTRIPSRHMVNVIMKQSGEGEELPCDFDPLLKGVIDPSLFRRGRFLGDVTKPIEVDWEACFNNIF